jgi:glycosyltransferase involved in cell wall biosynthesis
MEHEMELLSLVEQIASRTPDIGQDYSDALETLVYEVQGVRTDVEKTNELLEKILRVLKNPPRR